MFAKSLCVLMAVGLAAGHIFPGVDPNSLKCDPFGLVLLKLPHFTNCRKYYVCLLGLEIEQTCPLFKIFDFYKQACYYEWATTCILRDRSDEIEGSGDDDYSFSSSDSSSDNSDSDSDSDDSDSDSSSDSDDRSLRELTNKQAQNKMIEEMQKAAMTKSLINCESPEGATAQLPYKGDCQRYWRCNGHNLEAVYCSDGLFYNQQTRQCDFEANAKCDTEIVDELAEEFIAYK